MSIRIPVFEPKNNDFELEFRLFVPPGQYDRLYFCWAPVSEPGFLDFQIFDSRDFYVRKIFSNNMLVRYRRINNKGVLERPGTKWRVLRTISSTLRFQFTVKCWKVDFLMPCKTRSCQSSREKFRMLRALLPDTPRPPQFQPELPKSHFLCKTLFFQVH